RYLKDVLFPVCLAKVVAIQHSYPELYAILKRIPRYLKDLEIHYNSKDANTILDDLDDPNAAATVSLPAILEPFGSKGSLENLFKLFYQEKDATFKNLSPVELRLYFTLAGQTESQQLKGVDDTGQIVQPEMTYVPASEFTMGSNEADLQWVATQLGKNFDERHYQRELPRHALPLDTYEIGRYPVTNIEYQAFVQLAPHAPPAHWEKDQAPVELADHPVTNISWEDAVAYCEWLSGVTNSTYRLPTEIEWERAARGTDARRFPWGEVWRNNLANTKDAGMGATTPVGQYSPTGDSPAGCADMSGNVFEWTADWLQPYPDNPKEQGRYKEIYKVIRGGSFVQDQIEARCAHRGGQKPAVKAGNIGFRCVREVS
ncbi:MAG: formylglycine-generating enzyme family protein, partial [Chloroflexota bacterium]